MTKLSYYLYVRPKVVRLLCTRYFDGTTDVNNCSICLDLIQRLNCLTGINAWRITIAMYVVPAIEKSISDQVLSLNVFDRDEVHLSVRRFLGVPYLAGPSRQCK